MITQIEKLIRENPEWLRSSRSSLSFMKVSTPSSGTGGLDNGKVLLLVFEDYYEMEWLEVNMHKCLQNHSIFMMMVILSFL